MVIVLTSEALCLCMLVCVKPSVKLLCSYEHLASVSPGISCFSTLLSLNCLFNLAISFGLKFPQVSCHYTFWINELNRPFGHVFLVLFNFILTVTRPYFWANLGMAFVIKVVFMINMYCFSLQPSPVSSL